MNDTENDAGKIDNKLKKIRETTDFVEIFIGKFVLLQLLKYDSGYKHMPL